MTTTSIIEQHYTACIRINSKTYGQMTIHEKINCKSYYEIFKDKGPWSLDHLMNWMNTNRLFATNYLQPYRGN